MQLKLYHNTKFTGGFRTYNKGWETTVNTRLPKLICLTGIGARLAFNKLALTIGFPDLNSDNQLQAQNLPERNFTLAQTRADVVEVDAHFFTCVRANQTSGDFFHRLNCLNCCRNGNT